ncbi:BTAD domain-containing putative transcriptional regulator [Corynebacterium sp. A21]|uniref:BTAD domain-containing putative transcriptional regulator n=1 Tax=Corynebacterium sp. A21 TaxID=3457318 RepID=UPI003FD3B2FA
MTTVPIQIDVLGSLAVRCDGVSMELPGPRLRAALAALTVHHPHPLSPEGLASAIWGLELPARPRGAVHTVVSRLRSVLGEGVLYHEPAGYRLELPTGAVDAHRFETLCRQADGLPPTQAADALDSALGLWRSPAYEEFADQEFAVAEIAHLTELRAATMEHRAVLALELDDVDTSVSLLQTVVTEQPLRERAHGLLMRALYRAGRTAKALDQYEMLRRRLVEELGLDPSPALRELQVQILDHTVPPGPISRHRHAPPPVSHPRLGRLPPSWKPGTGIFIGRDEDMTQLLHAATAHRLVCVTGPGGVGKSRLVAETLPELTRRVGRPAVVVELEDVLPGQVVERVAVALDLGKSAEPWAAVTDYLASSSLILVLDACERVLDRLQPLVWDILRAAPGVIIVATSRICLDLGVEQVLPLSPLPLPGPADEPHQAALTPAMRLFIERLRRVRPGSDLSPALTLDAAEICRRLDGLPLALELAATQAATIGVRPILASLDKLPHLVGRPGHLLHAVVARSHDLLEQSDRTLLGRLSVFTGSFELADAEQIAPDGHAAAGLSRLVTASLVDPIDDGPVRRFRLLGIIRAFAAEHADDGTQSAYWQWAVESTGRWAREATGPDAALALRRLEIASADLILVVEQTLAASRLDLTVRIVGHIGQCVHWIPGAPLSEVLLRVGDHSGLAGTPGESLARGTAALAAVERGELTRAEHLGQSARETATTPEEQFLAYVALGVTAVYIGDWTTATRRWHQVLAADGLPDAYAADAYSCLALLSAQTGKPEQAEEHAAAARLTAERSGAPPRIAFALYASGEALLVTDPAAAVDVLRKSAQLAEDTNATQVSTVARVALLSALTRTGRTREATELALTLLELQQSRGHWSQLWNTMRILAELFVAESRLDTAELILASAEASESAPGLAGADVERHRLLRRRTREVLGADRIERIETVARLLPRTEILNRVRQVATAVSKPKPDGPEIHPRKHPIMIYAPDFVIDQVRYWAVAHPEQVQNLLDAAAEVPQDTIQTPSWAGLTNPATTAEVVRKQIEYKTMDLTEAAQVRSAAYRQIQRALIQAVETNLAFYLDHFRTFFDAAATDYTKALEELPDEPFTAAEIVQAFTQKQTQAYRAAQDAVGKLESVQNWLQELQNVIPSEKFEGSPVFLILDPGSVETMAEVLLFDYSSLDALYTMINPALAHGLRTGGTLRLALPSEAAAGIAGYEARRQGMPNAEWLALRRSIESH